MKTLTLRKGEALTLNGIVWTIAQLYVVSGKVKGVYLHKPAGLDVGGDTTTVAIDCVYLTAAMLRKRMQ